MPYDAEKAGDVKKVIEKLKKTYKNVSDTAARQAIHVFNSVMDSTGDEGKAWASVYSKMNERGLSKNASAAQRVAARYAALKQAGASGFVDFVRGDDARQCFREAREEALYDHRNHWDDEDDGDYEPSYTGTIAEKNKFVLRSQEPMSMADANKFADKDIEKNDKWGPAFAVPVADPSGKRVIGYLFYGYASN